MIESGMKSKKPIGVPEEHPDGPKMDVPTKERQRLKVLRKNAGLTQEQLATRIGVSNGTISNFETGSSGRVFREVYAKIVHALSPKTLKASDTEAKTQTECFAQLMLNSAELTADQLRVVDAVVQAIRSGET